MSGTERPENSGAEEARALANEAIEAEGVGDAAEAKFLKGAARDLDARAADQVLGAVAK